MFDHLKLDHFAPNTLPLHRDCFLCDSTYMDSFLDLKAGNEWTPPGCTSFAAVRLVCIDLV